jgi:hypothetical protein
MEPKGNFKPIFLTFKGLKTTSIDPTKARVVYIEIVTNANFLNFVNVANEVTDRFGQAGFKGVQ